MQIKLISVFSIFQPPTIHSARPPNLAQAIDVKCSWEYADLPRALHNNSFAKSVGQAEWTMGNWKIENCLVLWKRRNLETRMSFRIVFKMFEKSNGAKRPRYEFSASVLRNAGKR